MPHRLLRGKAHLRRRSDQAADIAAYGLWMLILPLCDALTHINSHLQPLLFRLIDSWECRMRILFIHPIIIPAARKSQGNWASRLGRLSRRCAAQERLQDVRLIDAMTQDIGEEKAAPR